MRYDVAVIGAGAMGSASLWQLAKRGAKVIGIEQFWPGHDLGSSHGESRIIRTAYFEDPAYVPLVQRSLTLWRSLEEESGESILTMTGALMIGLQSSDVLSGTLASIRRHNLPHEILNRVAMEQRYPQHRLLPDDIAIYEPSAGFLRPELGVVTMANLAQREGAAILSDTRLIGLTADSDGYRIATSNEEHQIIEADVVVAAAGAWLPYVVPSLSAALSIERQVQTWFALPEEHHFSPDRFPVFVRELADGRSAYGFPSIDGKQIKVAFHHSNDMTTANTVDRAVRRQDLQRVEAYVREYLPDIEPIAMRGKVCMYTNTPDKHFIIGEHPSMKHLIVVGGFSGHGYKFAPVVGEIAADLALQGTTSWPLDIFSPARFDVTA